MSTLAILLILSLTHLVFTMQDPPSNMQPIGIEPLSFSDFENACQHPKKGQTTFRVILKGSAFDRDWHECVFANGGLTVTNLDAIVPTKIEEKDLVDWHFVDNGWLVGGKSIRSDYQSMNEEEQLNFNFRSRFIIRQKADDVDAGHLLDAIGHDDAMEADAILERRPDLLEKKLRFVSPYIQIREGDYTLIHPIHYASYIGSVDCLRLFIEKNANTNSLHCDGKTALHWTCFGHFPQTLLAAKILVEAGSQLDLPNDKGVSPLMRAQIHGNDEMFQFLLSVGANPKVVTKSGETLLHELRDVRYFQFLDQYGLDVNATNAEKQTPLHYAATSRYKNTSPDNVHWKIAIELVKRGADLYAKDREGKTPLDIIREYTNESYAKELEQMSK